MFACIDRDCSINVLAFGGTGIQSRHRDVHPSLLHKDEVVCMQRAHFCLIETAVRLDLCGSAFCRIARLFFRVSCSVARVRCMLDGLAATCSRSSNKQPHSLRVASGWAWTKPERLAYGDRSNTGWVAATVGLWRTAPCPAKTDDKLPDTTRTHFEALC